VNKRQISLTIVSRILGEKAPEVVASLIEKGYVRLINDKDIELTMAGIDAIKMRKLSTMVYIAVKSNDLRIVPRNVVLHRELRNKGYKIYQAYILKKPPVRKKIDTQYYLNKCRKYIMEEKLRQAAITLYQLCKKTDQKELAKECARKIDKPNKKKIVKILNKLENLLLHKNTNPSPNPH